MSILTDPKANILYSGGLVQSVLPPEREFGYTYFSSMIPPFKPKRMLMLGYGYGTTPKLAKKIWGDDFEIVGVDDKSFRESEGEYLEKGAFHYVKECTESFDYVAIDLFNGDQIPGFVFDEEFVQSLKRIATDLISINVINDEKQMLKLKIYEDNFRFEYWKAAYNNRILFYRNDDAIEDPKNEETKEAQEQTEKPEVLS